MWIGVRQLPKDECYSLELDDAQWINPIGIRRLTYKNGWMSQVGIRQFQP